MPLAHNTGMIPATTIYETPPPVPAGERAERLQKLRELIESIAICMVATTGVDGSIHSRPMAYLHMEPGGELIFFTRAVSSKVDEVRRNRHVNVAFSDPSRNLFVSISGDARVANDRARMAALFTPIMKQWFPGGVDDPTLRLLIVDPLAAEYWDGPSGLTLFLRVAKSVITGAPADLGEHEFLEL